MGPQGSPATMNTHQHIAQVLDGQTAQGNCSRTLVWGLRAAVAALIIFHLYSLTKVPAPHLDEAWFIARAWGFAQHGYPFGVLDSGVFDKLPGYQHFFPYLPTAIQAIPFLFSDSPDLFAFRLISLCFGLSIVFCAYILGTWASDPVAGLFSAILLLVSPYFWLSGHIARIDVEAAAVGFIGLTIVLTNTKRSWLRCVVGGLLAGIAVEFHAHAAVITVPALAAGWTLGSSTRERLLSFLLTGAGCSLGGALYAALHVLPDPSAFWVFQRLAFAPTHTPPLLTFHLPTVVAGIEGAFLSLFTGHFLALPLGAVLYIVGLALTRGRIRTICALAALATLSVGVLIRHKFWYYGIYAQPLMLVFAATVSRYLFRELDGWRGRHRICGRILQGCVLGICLRLPVATAMDLASIFQNARTRNVLPDISGLIRQDDRILGTQTFWLSARNSRYYAPEYALYYTRWRKESSVSDALRQLDPTLIIEDDHLRQLSRSYEPGCAYVCLPDDGLERLIASSDLVAELPSDVYGPIKFYRPRGKP
jgi:hypothetical protein